MSEEKNPRRQKNIREKLSQRMKNRMEEGTYFKNTWKVLRPISIYAISLAVVAIIIITGVTTVNKYFFAAVEPGNDQPVMLVIYSGSSMSAVAGKLYDMGLLNSKWGIKLLADFTNRTSKVKAGEYILDRSMTAEQILDLITQPKPVRRAVKVVLREGIKAEDIASILQEEGVIESASTFMATVQSANGISDYEFLPDLKTRDKVRYMLEGYIFPDTYDFYIGSSDKTVIDTLLKRFDDIYTDEYAVKAQELGMTMNDVITLASIIQSEGTEKDFAKVSAVFHNRLNSNMKLQTDVCIQYALNVKRLVLTADDLAVDSPYNMHINNGLPPGPICSPGKKAIEAALNPDQTIIDGGYYYFTLTDPATGELAFSKTYEEHLRVVEKWRPVWEEYDRNH